MVSTDSNTTPTPTVNPNVVYGLDIYHGDSISASKDETSLQFGAMTDPKITVPPRNFIWIKATQSISYIDPLLRLHADHARQAKTLHPDRPFFIGGYHFMSSSEDHAFFPEKQAAHFLAALKSVSLLDIGCLIPMLDLEPDPSNDMTPPRADLAFELAHLIKEAIGFWPVIYASQSDYINYYIETFPPGLHTLCIARYNQPPTGIHPAPAFHQYTDKGHLPYPNNPSQDVDFNVFNGSLETLQSKHLIRLPSIATTKIVNAGLDAAIQVVKSSPIPQTIQDLPTG